MEAARERAELQKAYYSFLHALTSNDLTSSLLATAPGALEAVIGALLQVRAVREAHAAGDRLCQLWVARGAFPEPVRLERAPRASPRSDVANNVFKS